MKGNDLKTALKELLLIGDNNIPESAPFRRAAEAAGITSLSAAKDLMYGVQGGQQSFDRWFYNYVNALIQMITTTDEATEAVTGLDKAISDMEKADALQKALSALTDVDKYNATDALKAMATIRDTLKELQGENYNLGEIPDAEQNPEAVAQWMENARAQAQALIESIKTTAQAYGILTEAEIEAAQAQAQAREEQEKYIESMRELAQSITDEIEAAQAKDSGYADQIAMLQEALDRGDVQGAAEKWKSFHDTIRAGIQNEYPLLVK